MVFILFFLFGSTYFIQDVLHRLRRDGFFWDVFLKGSVSIVQAQDGRSHLKWSSFDTMRNLLVSYSQSSRNEKKLKTKTKQMISSFASFCFPSYFPFFFVLVKKQIGKMKMSEVVSWSFVSCEICPFLD